MDILTAVKDLMRPDAQVPGAHAEISVLDEASDLARREGTAQGPNVMYFETGQGTALSSNQHHGTDQVTMEAPAYGLARRYKPFLVNSVVGFIGPEYLRDAKEITRAGLEDHFMGKLSGLNYDAAGRMSVVWKRSLESAGSRSRLRDRSGCLRLGGLPAAVGSAACGS